MFTRPFISCFHRHSLKKLSRINRLVKAARCYQGRSRQIRAYGAKDQSVAATCLAWQKRRQGTMKLFFSFVAIVTCAISYDFSVLAADEEPVAAESSSKG